MPLDRLRARLAAGLLFLVGIPLCAVLPSGCSYLSSRALDFTDILAAGISTGGGVDVRALPTRLLSLEGGARHNERFYGWRRRYWRWQESSYGIFIVNFFTPHVGGKEPPPWGWGDICKTSHSLLTLLPPEAADSKEMLPLGESSIEEQVYRFFVLTEAENTRFIDVFDVEVGVSALIGGLQVVVSPGELVDFLAGIFFLDLSGDDGEASPQERAPEDTAKATEGSAERTEGSAVTPGASTGKS
jgi:hypothetical protein